MISNISVFVPISSITLFLFGAFNVLAFLFMLWDKRQSRMSGAERLSEGLLFFLAAMFGSLGVYLGMFVLRHKTHKWYFLLGIPIMFVQNCLSVFVVWYWIERGY